MSEIISSEVASFVYGDFNPGLGSLLSVRGEGIRSWVSDDNFVVEDEKPSTLEASFFSLNLHALAEQLEKVDLSERLFIEPDLLASVAPDQVSATNEVFDQIGTLDSNETITTTSTVINQTAEVVSSGSATNAHSDSVSPNEGINRVSQKKEEVVHSGKSSRGGCLHSSKQSYGSSVANNGEKVSSFEATVSEAELYKLLDSFNDSTSPTSASPISTKAVPLHHPADSYIPKHVTSNVDDILDDLLNQPFKIKPTSKETQASQSITNASNVNNVLDDLLNQPLEVKPTSKETETSSQSATKSKLLDDFDSWLDTI